MGIANKEPAEALRVITEALFDRYQYDTISGAPRYVDMVDARLFYLTAYIQKNRGRIVNCNDQARALTVLGRLLGLQCTVYFNGLNWIGDCFGYITPTYLTGLPHLCNNPFYSNTAHTNAPLARPDAILPERSAFGNHEYVLCDGKVFDGCTGPSKGTQSHSAYLNTVIDRSTYPELNYAGQNLYVVSDIVYLDSKD